MSRTDPIEDRVAQLERSNRRLVTVIVTFAVAVLAGGSYQSGDVVSAEAFHLLDRQGNVVAELASGPEGTGLIIRDALGQERVKLAHESEQSGLFVLDDTGHSRIGIAQFSHGGGGVALHGEEGKGAAVLYFKGTGTLSFYDAAGGVVHRLPEN